MEFTPQIFKFDTGITLSINEDKILAKNDNKNRTASTSIVSDQIDNFKYNFYWEGRISPAGMWLRFVAISVILVIISENVFGGFSTNTFSLVGILLIINIIVFFVFIIDAMLQLNIFSAIIKEYFSNKVYSVTIGNMSGNNIEFYVMINELKKLKELEEVIANLKTIVVNKKEENSSTNEILQSNSTVLDEIQKLGKLFKDGILTQDEFDNKKQELLKKL